MFRNQSNSTMSALTKCWGTYCKKVTSALDWAPHLLAINISTKNLCQELHGMGFHAWAASIGVMYRFISTFFHVKYLGMPLLQIRSVAKMFVQPFYFTLHTFHRASPHSVNAVCLHLFVMSFTSLQFPESCNRGGVILLLLLWLSLRNQISSSHQACVPDNCTSATQQLAPYSQCNALRASHFNN